MAEQFSLDFTDSVSLGYTSLANNGMSYCSGRSFKLSAEAGPTYSLGAQLLSGVTSSFLNISSDASNFTATILYQVNDIAFVGKLMFFQLTVGLERYTSDQVQPAPTSSFNIAIEFPQAYSQCVFQLCQVVSLQPETLKTVINYTLGLGAVFVNLP